MKINTVYYPNIDSQLLGKVEYFFSGFSINSTASQEVSIIPGFTDVHVHFREPGFSYKETIRSGSTAAARGGYTSVCTMPNLNPVPDSKETLEKQLEIIRKDAVINVYPYGAITKAELGKDLANLEEMAPNVIAFSDDGKGVQTDEMMKEAMEYAKSLNKIIAAHCEVNSLLEGGYIHKGEYAKIHNHRGICSESEWRQIERDINLAQITGAKYHVCHISTKESVELIRQAKKSNVDITCETGPHYLVFDDSNLKEAGNWKMNPPLRDRRDKEALLEGVIDGTIDMIATDHAPHSEEEKSRGLEKSAFGVVGLETAFPVLYTKLVKENVITMEKLLKLLIYNPNERFGIKQDGFSVWNLNEKYKIDPSEFKSMGRSTPFEGMDVFGKCLLTVAKGDIVYGGK